MFRVVAERHGEQVRFALASLRLFLEHLEPERPGGLLRLERLPSPFVRREVVIDDPSSRSAAGLAVDDEWIGHHFHRLFAFRRAAAVFAADVALPPLRPSATACGFLRLFAITHTSTSGICCGFPHYMPSGWHRSSPGLWRVIARRRCLPYSAAFEP